MALLKEAEAGRRVADICREQGITPSTFYPWRSQYGGMEASNIKKLKEYQQQNDKLKRMYADIARST